MAGQMCAEPGVETKTARTHGDASTKDIVKQRGWHCNWRANRTRGSFSCMSVSPAAASRPARKTTSFGIVTQSVPMKTIGVAWPQVCKADAKKVPKSEPCSVRAHEKRLSIPKWVIPVRGLILSTECAKSICADTRPAPQCFQNFRRRALAATPCRVHSSAYTDKPCGDRSQKSENARKLRLNPCR